jgi:(2Fe-2S) ferredoxin
MNLPAADLLSSKTLLCDCAAKFAMSVWCRNIVAPDRVAYGRLIFASIIAIIDLMIRTIFILAVVCLHFILNGAKVVAQSGCIVIDKDQPLLFISFERFNRTKGSEYWYAVRTAPI